MSPRTQDAEAPAAPESRIRVLAPEVAAKIAAGEVVERPASVLKELLENSLDSGASRIDVEIGGAGKTLLRVVDDGAGMTPEECRLAFERHATSKLRELEDLAGLETMGFRGEALHAIAAVSEVSLRSSRDELGWKIELSAGKLVKESEAPPVQGTSVEVRSLFFNTPARLEFLKTDGVERSRLSRVVEEVALARLGLTLTLRLEGRVALKVGPAEGEGALETRVGEVLGLSALEGLVPCSLERPEARLHGLVSRPSALAATRNLQYFFVNGRPVASRVLQQAVYKAYEDRGRKHPACVLFLEVPPEAVDVNVHPQKAEVRFKDEGRIFELVAAALGRTLTLARQPAPLAPDAPPPPLKTRGGKPLLQFPSKPAAPADEPPGELVREPAPAYAAAPAWAAPKPSPLQPALMKERKADDPAWWTPPFRYLGQIEATYLVFEAAGGLLLVDQHAAAERVRFERYLAQAAKGRPAVQRLMVPIQVELPLSQFLVLTSLKDALHAAGLEVEPFGEKALAVHAVPDVFPLDAEGVRSLVASLGESHDPSAAALEAVREAVATAACKASVKAHERVSPPEALRLLEDLKKCKAPVCPHGRPALVALDRGELARKFKRPGPPPLG